MNLNIEAEPEPEGEGPTFIDKPRIVSENNGKLVIMDCKVKANPKPDIIWRREGEVVKESGKCIMTMREKGDIYYIRLELIEPALEDSGLYKCNIKNNLGELNANLTLNIESEFPIYRMKKREPKIIFHFSLSLSVSLQLYLSSKTNRKSLKLSRNAPLSLSAMSYRNSSRNAPGLRKPMRSKRATDTKSTSYKLRTANLLSNWKYPKSPTPTRVRTR